MLDSLDFLSTGQPWPPPSEIERLKLYEKNRLLFEGKHNRRFMYLTKFLRQNQKNIIDIILNWPRRLSTLWADLLLTEPPKFTIGEIDSEKQNALTNYTKKNFLPTLYKCMLDRSMYADGLLKILYNGKAIIKSQNPFVWFPVVTPDDAEEVQYHVLAWSYRKIENNKQQWYLKAEIHDKGSITTRVYKLNSIDSECKIGELIEDETILTGIDDFLIIQIPNLITTARTTGLDDYSDLNSIIQELENRITRLGQIFNKHSSPSMYGSDNAIEVDPVTNETTYNKNDGDYIALEKGEQPPGYITWDGNVEGCFKELDFLMNQLYALSETCPAAFGESRTGYAESGTALRLRMYAPLTKTNRGKMFIDPAIKQAISIASKLDTLNNNGTFLPEEEITIHWQDGLPADDKEMAEIMNIRTGGKPTISQETAIRRMDNSSEIEVQREIERIQMDEIQNNPISPSVFSMGAQDVTDNNLQEQE